MNTRIGIALAAATLAWSGVAVAQQPQPPVRQIGPVLAVSHDSLASVTAAVPVGGGRIYVNDITGRRVLLYDSTLGTPTVIADSDGTTGNPYGNLPGTLLPFHGDSALLVTPASMSMEVLGASGAVARVMALPPSGMRGLPALIGNIFGTPGFDAEGRLVYFSPARMQLRAPVSEGSQNVAMETPDSALIVRFNFATRTVDTAGVIRIARNRTNMTRGDNGQMHIAITAVPPATIDDWAVTSDGRIAIVRGRDYHVDWLGADGTWTSSPRVPFAWERLDDQQKQALIDSTAAAMQEQIDSMQARMARASGTTGQNAQAPRAQGERGSMTIVMAGPGGGDAGPRGGGPGPGGGGPTRIQITPTVVKAELADVPDYRPAFRQAAVRADADGNLWIRTTTVADGRPVYDVVNGRGELADRVQLPPFRTIAGFGPGVIYMGVQDSSGVAHLERAKIR